MASLKIQVLGSGLIPRGYGIAPKKAPFPADLTLIQTILNTPGLKVRMVHPQNGNLIQVTKATVKRLWDKYSEMECQVPAQSSVKKEDIPQVPPQKPNINLPIAPIPGTDDAQHSMVKDAVNAAASEVFGSKKDEVPAPSVPVDPPKTETPVTEDDPTESETKSEEKNDPPKQEEKSQKDNKPNVTVKPYGEFNKNKHK